VQQADLRTPPGAGRPLPSGCARWAASKGPGARTRTLRKARCSSWCNRGTSSGRRSSVWIIPVDLSDSRDVHRCTPGPGWRQALPWSG